ncbi:MAG: Dabb family protein [Pseudomonadales bacterium]|nr:Dabb family protein [Pseudomonadales bacterium]
MIRRISMWQLKNGGDAEEMKEALLSMKGNVSSLSDIEVGINVSTHKSAYDIVFVGTFADKEALLEFESDEFHRSVGCLVSTLRGGRVVIEYEC